MENENLKNVLFHLLENVLPRFSLMILLLKDVLGMPIFKKIILQKGPKIIVRTSCEYAP
jgi:hypothetical protein